MRAVISAYSCEPHKGSEPGIGWHIASGLARHHEVWVITRANNEEAISKHADSESLGRMHFLFFDLPPVFRMLKRGKIGLELYYYLWQVGAFLLAREQHRKLDFQIAHHVTFGRYWSPSLLALLPIPFVWGPVGGGESTPDTLIPHFGTRGRWRERLRDVARWFGEHDPLVRLTARRSAYAIVTTNETGERVERLGARRIVEVSQIGLSGADYEELQGFPEDPPGPIRFLSMGRLLEWKGFHFGVEAFAEAQLPDAEYWIVGAGPQKRRLAETAARMGVSDRVRFLGAVSRDRALLHLSQCHALVHPSTHDSGGWVLLEAMAAGRPVVCLDTGGPATIVTEETGFKIRPQSGTETVRALAAAMRQIAQSRELRLGLGRAGKERIRTSFPWSIKAATLSDVYGRAMKCAS